MIVSLFEMNRSYKVAIMAVLLALAVYLTHYHHHMLGIGTVFTHFYYIPIVLACIWWKRRGLGVVIVLSLLLLVSHYLFRGNQSYANNLMRIVIFFMAAAVSVLLSEGFALARQRAEENRQWYETIFHNAGTAMVILDDDALISLVNAEFENLTGYAKDEVENVRTLFDLIPEGHRRNASLYYYHTKKQKFFEHRFVELKLTDKFNRAHDIRLTLSLIPDTTKVVASLTDLTDFKAAMEEQERLKTKLSATLTKVLSGYLPICAWCKKIRDENGQWNALESYIHDRTQADFTHTICPQCAREIYPELMDNNTGGPDNQLVT